MIYDRKTKNMLMVRIGLGSLEMKSKVLGDMSMYV